MILGDLVNNLRSSLDLATCALVEKSQPNTDLYHVKFPFIGKNGLLKSKDESSACGGCTSVISTIREAKSAAGEGLNLLAAMSNQDKHRAILPCLFQQRPINLIIDQENSTGYFQAAPHTALPISDHDIGSGHVVAYQSPHGGMEPPHIYVDLGFMLEGRSTSLVLEEIRGIVQVSKIALEITCIQFDASLQ